MLRLLIADDEQVERLAMHLILTRNFGDIYELDMASNGIEVVEKACKFQPHLIFMDIKMPGSSGIEAAKKIKEFLPEVHIVFVTAYDYFDYAKEALELDAEAILLKPVEIPNILEITQKVTIKINKRLEFMETKRKIDSTFDQIKRQFQEEFIEMLSNFNTKPEQLGNYLKLMDIPFHCGVAAVINISNINLDENLSAFQKGIYKTRFIEKIHEASKKSNIVLLTGHVGDAIKLLFVFPIQHTLVTHVETMVDDMIQAGVQIIKQPLSYGISEPMFQESLLPDAMYRANVKAFTLDQQKEDAYPYTLEDECVQAISRLEIKEARSKMNEIAAILQREYPYQSSFNREVRGLYSVIKRALRQKFGGNLTVFAQTDERIGVVDNYSSMITLFTMLFDYIDAMTDKKQDKNELLIMKLCDHIEKNYNKDITLEEAANYIGFSPYYLAKLFKEYKKVSYIDYVIRIRVKMAKQLLDTTNMNINEVGYAVGYEDANYFTRVFKKVEGLTPSSYKNRI